MQDVLVGSTRRRGRAAGMLAVAALLAAGLVVSSAEPAAAAPGPAPIEQRNAQTVTADPLPTVQIDSGVVWAQVINGSTVYAGGSFSNARPAGAAPGTNLFARNNILAYNITTGVATSFAPNINGTVKSLALSPDGSRLYVGGQFTQVNGQSRFNVAAFSTSTGALLDTFRPAIGGSFVNAIVATNSAVYFGGSIGAAGGATRRNLAAASPTNGAILGWAPVADHHVDAMVLAPAGDKVIIGGRFGSVNGASARGLAALSLTDGALLPWAVTSVVKNTSIGASEGRGAGIWGLTTDSNGAVYGTGWVYGGVSLGNLEGIFSADGGSGAVRWIADCHGDHYGVYSDGTNVYSTGHEHDCQTAGGMPQLSGKPGNMKNATVYTAATKGTLTRSPYVGGTYTNWSGYPAPAAVNWYPDWSTGSFTGQGQAGWTVTGNGAYVVVGGEFPAVNNQRFQGLVRFARSPSTGKRQGPRLSGATWTPTARSATAGTARVQIPANWDRDDLNLTYELWAQGGAAPLATKSVKSTYWYTPTITFAADGIPAGSSRTYRVVARDGDGNAATSADVTVSVNGTSTSSYADVVLDDGATTYWRLGGASGLTDQAGGVNATPFGGVGTTSDDALASEANGSATFNGTSTGLARSSAGQPLEESFAVELWFKTSTSSGGKLVGYGNAGSGASTNYDRHLYMRNDGTLVFGVNPQVQRTISTPAAYRDNQWHHAVAQLDPWAGIQLYVDGTLVASEPSATAAQLYTGMWRLGGDNLASWPNRPSSDYFNGQLDEFAVYPKALTASQISAHYAIGRGQSAPTASFTTSGSNLAWSFNGSGSSAPSGRTITSYAWNFGDGSTGSGVNASRTYANPGTYTVTLTVTDSAGMTASTTRTVNATATHQAPVAVINAAVSGLTASFSGTGSTASGGATITGYSWNFGDGTTSTQASPTKTYAAAGTYTVTLTVTDSMGATSAPATRSVTVTAQAFVARDDFERSVASGWGTATVGGAWTTNNNALFSVSGGVGRMSMSAGQTRSAALSGLSVQNQDARLLLSTDKVADGGGLHFNYQVHKTTAGEYRLKLRISATGVVTVSIAKLVGTTETLVANKVLTGYTYTAGGKLQLRLQSTTAGGSTTLNANVWADGSQEPASWFLTATDAQAELQGAGQIGVLSYLSGTATNAPVGVTVDNLEVR
ncbi:PKD domain-containing protein [Micromonospora sp. DT81.3]|uniref:PKD domain-containing protein n=1 Tax=Micromonospora sp. DT81.3 TaxID=3416523 RepID=UPI003CF1ED71